MTKTDYETYREMLKSLLKERAVFKGGPFQLSSGGETDILVDCSKVLRTNEGNYYLRQILSLGQYLNMYPVSEFAAVGGPLTGSDLMAMPAMLALDIPSCFGVRKMAKAHKGVDSGELTGDLGPIEYGSILLIEDVCTSGRSMLRAADVIEEQKRSITMAMALVDRGGLDRVGYELECDTFAFYKLEELI